MKTKMTVAIIGTMAILAAMLRKSLIGGFTTVARSATAPLFNASETLAMQTRPPANQSARSAQSY